MADQRHFPSLLLILLYCTGGKCVVVKTRVGDDAVLPCEADPTQAPTFDRTRMAIEWSRPDLPDQYVHFQRNGKEVTDDKNPSYKGRTSLFMDEVKKDNVSLKLSRVTPSDAANYTCFLPEISQKRTVVQLIIEVPTDGEFPVWGGLIILGGVIIMLLLSVLGYWKRQDILVFVHSRFSTPETPAGDEDRSKDGVSELSPMNGVSVDKPVLNGTPPAVV